MECRETMSYVTDISSFFVIFHSKEGVQVFITPNILYDFFERSGVKVSLSGSGGMKLRDVRPMRPGVRGVPARP
jgi:hypothetical protein